MTVATKRALKPECWDSPPTRGAAFYVRLYRQMIQDILFQKETTLPEAASWRARQVITLSLLKHKGLMEVDLQHIRSNPKEWGKLAKMEYW